jgi:EAL domain-containing protein (putative c-di-GMP-specific phosphodiesterase class I)
VGEGAETLAEADILMKGGINHIQGFAYGLPSIERIWLDPNHAERHTTGVSGGNDASSRVA